MASPSSILPLFFSRYLSLSLSHSFCGCKKIWSFYYSLFVSREVTNKLWIPNSGPFWGLMLFVLCFLFVYAYGFGRFVMNSAVVYIWMFLGCNSCLGGIIYKWRNQDSWSGRWLMLQLVQLPEVYRERLRLRLMLLRSDSRSIRLFLENMWK